MFLLSDVLGISTCSLVLGKGLPPSSVWKWDFCLIHSLSHGVAAGVTAVVRWTWLQFQHHHSLAAYQGSCFDSLHPGRRKDQAKTVKCCHGGQSDYEVSG